MLSVNQILAIPIKADHAGREIAHRDLDGAKPGDDYCLRVTSGEVLALLERNGWQVERERGGTVYLTRPGKEGGVSATFGYVAPNVLYVFSSSCPEFEGGRAYSPFSVYGLLECGGDFKRAADSLRERGYGQARSTDSEFKTERVASEQLKVISFGALMESNVTLSWAARGFLLKEGLHFLTAPPAGGKSWLALEIARCVAMGEPIFGCYHTESSGVLYIDEEMGDGLVKRRGEQLGVPHDVPIRYMGRQGFHLGNVDHRRMVANECQTHEIGLVIFDTLRGCCPGLQENEASHVTKVREWFKQFQQIGCTVLVLHHDRKGGQGETGVASDRMVGSGDFGGMADMGYAIDKSSGGWYSLSTIKNRLFSEDEAPKFSYSMEEKDGRIVFDAINVREERQKALVEFTEGILDHIRLNGGGSASTIAEVLGYDKVRVGTALNILHEKNLLTKTRTDGKVVYDAQKMF